ncbi:hypothetical protein B0J12DRAFT_773238 [Macrophomina phaseolina]|uniref:Ankyrin repeat-containing domain protein n=1 Tax=Macrophomina phaseolina TaxID=35725 RepID=A0ABQ8FU94_9PEZI|nr:hypothetical protein B0J12DRAFT_773238 [Macrophomina phaseolina]
MWTYATLKFTVPRSAGPLTKGDVTLVETLAPITRNLDYQDTAGVDLTATREFTEGGQQGPKTALDIAVERGNFEVARELILNYRARHLTMDIGNVVTTLLNLGANPSCVDRYGELERSALLVAARSGHLSILDDLIRHVADTSIRQTRTEKSLAHAAVQLNNVEVVNGLFTGIPTSRNWMLGEELLRMRQPCWATKKWFVYSPGGREM